MKCHSRAYFAIFRQQLLSGLQYRAGFWGGTATHIFWAYVRVAIIIVFYRHGSGGDGMALQQAVSLLWLQEIALNLLPGYGVDVGVWDKIQKGDVGYDLIRPLDVYSHWYVSALSNKLSLFLLSVGPVGLAALLMPGEMALKITAPLPSVLAGLFTLCTGLVVSCAAICLKYGAQMDVNVGEAPARVMALVMQILGGYVLPLQLWPDFMQGFLKWQPFASMIDLPLRFMAGTASLSELPQVLLVQLIWGVVLWRLGRAWIGRNLKRLIVQGG